MNRCDTFWPTCFSICSSQSQRGGQTGILLLKQLGVASFIGNQTRQMRQSVD